MMRNLLGEFRQDLRLRPIVGPSSRPGKGSLVDDWMFTRHFPETGISTNVAREMCRLRFDMVSDGRRGTGRILYVSAPNLRGTQTHEVVRGWSLGELFDLVSAMSDDDCMKVLRTFWTSQLLTQDEYDNKMLDDEITKQQVAESLRDEMREILSSGHMEVRNGVVVFVSDEAIRRESERYAQTTMYEMVRTAFREDEQARREKTIGETDTPALDEVIELAHSYGDVGKKMCDDAIDRYIQVLKRRMERSLEVLKAKSEGRHMTPRQRKDWRKNKPLEL